MLIKMCYQISIWRDFAICPSFLTLCVQSIRGLYGDATVEMDASVGVVMETLRKFGLDKNTLVLFTR